MCFAETISAILMLAPRSCSYVVQAYLAQKVRIVAFSFLWDVSCFSI
eukprot:SAG31_NODE_37748_length_301_cov_2.198020_1_plen_46_part_10